MRKRTRNQVTVYTLAILLTLGTAGCSTTDNSTSTAAVQSTASGYGQADSVIVNLPAQTA